MHTTASERRRAPGKSGTRPTKRNAGTGSALSDVADAQGIGSGSGFRQTGSVGNGNQPANSGGNVADTGYWGSERQGNEERGCTTPLGWLPEPNVGRVAYGIPRRVDRLKALGNAVVPQVVEMIGWAILETEENPDDN